MKNLYKKVKIETRGVIYDYYEADLRSIGGGRKKFKTVAECKEYTSECLKAEALGTSISSAKDITAKEYLFEGKWLKHKTKSINGVYKFKLDDRGLRVLTEAGKYMEKRYELYKIGDLSFAALEREYYTCRKILSCLNPKEPMSKINGDLLNESLDSQSVKASLMKIEDYEFAKAKAHGGYKSTFKSAKSIFKIYSRHYKTYNPMQHTTLIKKSSTKAAITDALGFKAISYEKHNLDDLFFVMFQSYKDGLATGGYDKDQQLKYSLSLKCQIMLLLGTGIRRGELTPLTWDCLEEEATTNNQIIYSLNINKSYSRAANLLKRPKNNKSRKSIIHPELYNELMKYKESLTFRELKHNLIFPNSKGELDKKCRLYYALNTANKRQHGPYKTHGHKWTTIHDLRHVYATEFIKQGGQLERLSKHLGHSSTRITEDVYVADYELSAADQIEDLQFKKPMHTREIN